MVDDRNFGIHLYAQVVLTHPFQQFSIRPFRPFSKPGRNVRKRNFFNVCDTHHDPVKGILRVYVKHRARHNFAFPPSNGMTLPACANVRQQARHDFKILQ